MPSAFDDDEDRAATPADYAEANAALERAYADEHAEAPSVEAELSAIRMRLLKLETDLANLSAFVRERWGK